MTPATILISAVVAGYLWPFILVTTFKTGPSRSVADIASTFAAALLLGWLLIVAITVGLLVVIL